MWELWCIDCRASLILVNGQPEPGQTETDAPTGPTTYALERIAKVPEAAAHLRRNTGHISKAGLARAIDIDRNTLNDWIARGWLAWPLP